MYASWAESRCRFREAFGGAEAAGLMVPMLELESFAAEISVQIMHSENFTKQ